VLLGRRRRDVGVDAGREAKRRARRARVRGSMVIVWVGFGGCGICYLECMSRMRCCEDIHIGESSLDSKAMTSGDFAATAIFGISHVNM